jgi:glucosyl-dolichyl phosphate glucuronosyltransferase
VKLSIIIATHARPDSLARLIASLKPQIQPSRSELIVAENGTPGGPTRLADADVVTQHIYDPRPGKCRVQNLAIKRASGDMLVFLDDDLIVAADYLDQVERFFTYHPEFAAMKGRILALEDPRKVAGANWIYLDLPLVDHGDEIIEVRGVLGANMAFLASAIAAVGPFDERLGPGAAGHEEETEMSARLRSAGYRIGYSPNALAHHEVDPARADRTRFIRIARERGQCRMIHESHSKFEVMVKNLVASARLAMVSMLGVSAERRSREERRLAVARGMLDALNAAQLTAEGRARA